MTEKIEIVTFYYCELVFSLYENLLLATYLLKCISFSKHLTFIIDSFMFFFLPNLSVCNQFTFWVIYILQCINLILLYRKPFQEVYSL